MERVYRGVSAFYAEESEGRDEESAASVSRRLASSACLHSGSPRPRPHWPLMIAQAIQALREKSK